MRVPRGVKLSHNTYRIGRSNRRYSSYGYRHTNNLDPNNYLLGFGFLFIILIIMTKPYLLLLLLLIPLLKWLNRSNNPPAPMKSRPSSLFIQRPAPEYCPSCNSAILPEGIFCQECGFNLSVVKN